MNRLVLDIKDFHSVKGEITTLGSKIFANTRSDNTAPTIERLFRAGAIMHCRTTTPEFAHSGTTKSPLWGITRNPWNLDYGPGGSSGGAGAAVAAGMTTIWLSGSPAWASEGSGGDHIHHAVVELVGGADDVRGHRRGADAGHHFRLGLVVIQHRHFFTGRLGQRTDALVIDEHMGGAAGEDAHDHVLTLDHAPGLAGVRQHLQQGGEEDVHVLAR